MKKIFVFLAITIVQIFFNQINAQTTYSGTVEYKYTRTKTGSGSGSNGYNWNAKADEKYIVEGRFSVVFNGDVSPSGVAMCPIKSIYEKVNFISTTDNEAQGERVSQACFDAVKRVSYTVSPGKSQIYKLAIESERLEPDKPCVTSGFLGIQCPPSDNKQGNCKYSIMLSGFIKANVTSAIYTEETFPCNKANNKPANLFTNTVKLDFPIVIYAEKDFHITDEILEGDTIITEIHNTDCRSCLDSGLKSIIPDIDDVNCAYDETSTISWYLVKRTKKCEPVITYLKGDIKINGKPAEQGGRGFEEGDIIETGSHSRVEIRTGNNEAIRLGSKSQLRWYDPCKPRKPLSDREAYLTGMRLTKGQAYAIVSRIVGKESTFEVKCRTAVIGVRGQLIQAPQTFYASTDPYFILEEIAPEKAELIEGYQYLSDNQTAFYIHFEDDVVKDISNLKGEVRIKEAKGFRQIDLPEGTSVSQWEDGTPMTEIVILTR